MAYSLFQKFFFALFNELFDLIINQVPASPSPVTLSSGTELSDFSDSELETGTDFRSLLQTEHRY